MHLCMFVQIREAQLYSSLSEAKGENCEPGSRKISVRKFIRDRILPLSTYVQMQKIQLFQVGAFEPCHPRGGKQASVVSR